MEVTATPKGIDLTPETKFEENYLARALQAKDRKVLIHSGMSLGGISKMEIRFIEASTPTKEK